ncbi:MAG: ABC transporter ATP-binding protein [bacterium]|nr:ABC transporter ATP-binding protein [bacterium]
MNNIIEIKDLTKKFNQKKAVDNLSLNIKQGEIFGLIGPDGAGKTTTLRILSGIMLPSSGRISVLGFSLPDDAEAVKEHIGYMCQKFNLYIDLTVNENINFFADLFLISRTVLEKRIQPLMEMTRLGPFRKRLAGDLSGGMKQKLALICTLIHRPKVLFLDEPTTGVDPVSRRDFWRILHNILLEGVTILVSTPYMDEAEWCNRIGLVFNGRMLSIATPHNLKKDLKSIVVEVPADVKITKGMVRDVPGLMDYQLLGEKHHIILRDEAGLNRLKNMAAHKDRIRIVPPTVEDVFINTIKESRK